MSREIISYGLITLLGITSSNN
jgi:hypothetical protein